MGQDSNIQQFNLNLIKIFSRVLKPVGALYLFGKDNYTNNYGYFSKGKAKTFNLDDSRDWRRR